MTMPAFNSVALRKRLLALDSMRQLVFGALCCERLIPNFIAFQRDSGVGDVSTIRMGLDYVWGVLSGGETDSNQVVSLLDKCEDAAPSADDYDSIYVTSAQDACFSICNLLDFLLDRDIEKIVRVATSATDSVDLFVQEISHMSPSDPLLEQKILMHPLMQRELEQQESDLRVLESISLLSQGWLSDLKKSAVSGGKGNLSLA